MPLIEGVPVEDASMTTFNFGGDITLTLNNRYTIPVAPADAFTQFEAGLAGTGYTIDPDSDPAEGYFDVLGGEFERGHHLHQRGLSRGHDILVDRQFV